MSKSSKTALSSSEIHSQHPVIALITENPPFMVNDAPYVYRYGTAGFRDKASRLSSVFVKVGVIAALQSRFFKGEAVGVMITASHNLHQDNGAKIMDNCGEMLARSWESFAGEFANTHGNACAELLNAFIEKQNITEKSSTVYIGRDTRESSEPLKELVRRGVEAMGGEVVDFGLVTTPQLHWSVRANHLSISESYLESLATAFTKLLGERSVSDTLYIDCANGIGAVTLSQFAKRLDTVLPMKLINTDVKNHEALNRQVGAEYVQKQQLSPAGVSPADRGKKFASIDGDADRVVYHFLDAQGRFQLLDGDKICALVTMHLQALLKAAGMNNVRMGVVQTAYANGASTKYLVQQLKVPVACVPTGVKFLHHKAAKFDVGVYFEANGHGTVLFSDSLRRRVEEYSGKMRSREEHSAIERLKAFMILINQAVGDAISDILTVEAVLLETGFSLRDWSEMYSDFPSYQSKAAVSDPSVIKTTDAERRIKSHPKLQKAIDKAVGKVREGRAFVRPSGTESVVRVYAEAKSAEEVKQLGSEIEAAIAEFL